MKQRAMVADVDASASRILEVLLSGFDYDLVVVKDDETAYKTFVEYGPDVVFVDTLLPRKGAFELIKRIRQTEGGDRVSVYVTSAIRGGSLKEESLSVWGAAGYLPKPLELDILRSQLAPSLSTKSADSKGGGQGEEEEVPEQGEFARSNFPMIFASLLRREAPIRLAAGLGKVRKAVHFDNGKIIFARSNLLAETLASYLQDKNFIDENQYREGVRVSIDQKKMIGEAFISLGAVTRGDIDAAIRSNIEEKVKNLFTWKSGWYKIMPHADPPAEIPGGPIEGWKLLWDEINTPAGQTHLSEYLTKLASRKIIEGPSPSEILDVTGFSQKDFEKVIGLAKGRPVVEACEDVGMRKMNLLYFLVLSGYLEVNEETSASGQGSEGFEELKRRELSRRLAWMSGRNHFQILGVQMTASDAEVSAAYGKLVGELRAGEDKLSGGGEARRLIGELSEIAGKSLEALSTRTKRDDYIESLKHGGDVPLSAEDRIKKAENSYKEGVTALKCQRWDEAIDRLGWAVDMNPSNAEYLIRHSEALLMREGGDKQTTLNRAESNLRKALEAESENPEIYYLLGRVQNAKGKAPQAIEYLQKALSLKPSYQAPALELKKMKDQSKGGFSLFGKRR